MDKVVVLCMRITITVTANTAPAIGVETFAFPALTEDMAHPVTLPAASDADHDSLTYSGKRHIASRSYDRCADGSKPLTIGGKPTAVGTASDYVCRKRPCEAVKLRWL